MSKKTPIESLQQRLTDLLQADIDIQARIKYTRALIDQQRKASNALAKARRLANKHGLELERDRDGYWVTYPPVIDTDKDPLDGSHFCVGGIEVLQAVEVYVEHILTPME